MWRGYEMALSAYMNIMIDQWDERGFVNNMYRVAVLERYDMPPWFGDDGFHSAHRSNLLRKEPRHYRKFWPDDRDDLAYVWPTK
jgi:hypothetical protein